jgi:hypothetical protein
MKNVLYNIKFVITGSSKAIAGAGSGAGAGVEIVESRRGNK